MAYAPQALYVTESRDYCLGVDLGTTFVAAAICDGTRPEMVTLGGRSVVIPSAVYLTEDGRLLCGEAAVHRSASDPTRSARGFFKRRLGDPTPLRMGDQTRSVTELLAALLSEVLRVVTELEGCPPREVMLTHPANWGPLRRRIFAEVAELANLGSVPTTTEPEAAASYYATSRNLPDGRLMGVYDLGGGTFDATVLRARHGGVEIVGVPEGIERLGGIDFDNALFTHLDLLCDGALSSLDANDARAAVTLARLEQDIVLAKEHLSVDARARVPVFLPDRTFDVVMTRAVFESLIRAHVESSVVALERTLGSAGVCAADLDAILLVGGSSRVPLVAEMLTEALGLPVAVDTHPKYAVALGAATLAAEVHTAASATSAVAVGAGRSSARIGGFDKTAGLGEAARELTRPMEPSRDRALALVGGDLGEAHADSRADWFADGWGERQTELMHTVSDLDLDEFEVSPSLKLVEPSDDWGVGSSDGDARRPEAYGGHPPADGATPGRGALVVLDGDRVEAARRARRVPARMLAAAVALLGTGAVGYWANRSDEPPVMDAAAPAQSCEGECASALPPPSAPQPNLGEAGCGDVASGCGPTRASLGPVAQAPRSASTSIPAARPHGVVALAPPVMPEQDVDARRVAPERSAPGSMSVGKFGGNKKSTKKGSEKKYSGKHRSDSDSSPILGGIV